MKEDTEEKSWDTIPVPSCWQLHGYGSPNYANVCYPYPVDPPYVPDENSMGVYEREFEYKGEMTHDGNFCCDGIWYLPTET